MDEKRIVDRDLYESFPEKERWIREFIEVIKEKN
jgi:hypothetical protein